MLILSPRAVERLESYSPPWPLPKIFRLTKGGKLIQGVFEGATINTPSMLCVEDYLDALTWAESVGGLNGLRSRADKNLSILTKWVEEAEWVDFLAKEPNTRSNTSACLKITSSWFLSLPQEEQAVAAKRLAALLDQEGVAFDIGAYRDAPAGLRIWTGATIEAADLEALTGWLDWAHEAVRAEFAQPD